MSTFLPHDPTPEEENNARAVIAALFDADTRGRNHAVLTPAEADVVEALRLRIRARLRHQGHEDKGAYGEAARRLVRAAQDVRFEQDRMTARHVAPIRRTHEDGTVCARKKNACTRTHVGYRAECQAAGCDWSDEQPIRAIVEENKRAHLHRAGEAR